MSRTITLTNGTVIVVRQIAAVGPIIHKEELIDDDGEGDPIPKRHWCIFDIWLVGGSKLYPAIEYSPDGLAATEDRTMVLNEIQNAGNTL